MDYEVKVDMLEELFDVVDLLFEWLVLVVMVGDGGCCCVFVDGYLWCGEVGVELKSFSGVINSDGGFVVLCEIDVVIDVMLKLILLICCIVNVVIVGSVGYCKLVM